MAVLAGGEPCHGSEARVGGLEIGEGRKAAVAYGLVSVDLGEIRLVDGAGADVLRLQTGRRSELMFDSEAPLHEIRCVQLAVRHAGDGDGRNTGCGISLR